MPVRTSFASFVGVRARELPFRLLSVIMRARELPFRPFSIII